MFKDAAADFLSNTIQSLHGKGVTTTHYALLTADHVQLVTYNFRCFMMVFILEG